MDAAALKSACLALPGAVEDFPFGPETSVFKVRARSGTAKVFALSTLTEPLRVSLKCEPALAEALRLAHGEITGGYHLNKRHWNDVDCSADLDETMIRNMIEDSYDLVAAGFPRTDRESLDRLR